MTNLVSIFLYDSNAAVSKAVLDELAAPLSDDERERAARFGHAGARRDFVTGRFLLRHALTRHCPTCLPKDWQFVIGPYGKPALADDSPALQFNLSHTKGLLACAITEAGAVGIDVETLERKSDLEKLARRFFSPLESKALLALPVEQRRERFFRIWTLKEAYIKARGGGLGISLGSFSYTFKASDALQLQVHEGEEPCACWQAHSYRVGAVHRLGLVLPGSAPPRVPALTLESFWLGEPEHRAQPEWLGGTLELPGSIVEVG